MSNLLNRSKDPLHDVNTPRDTDIYTYFEKTLTPQEGKPFQSQVSMLHLV